MGASYQNWVMPFFMVRIIKEKCKYPYKLRTRCPRLGLRHLLLFIPSKRFVLALSMRRSKVQTASCHARWIGFFAHIGGFS